jgi:hypothetical protein
MYCHPTIIAVTSCAVVPGSSVTPEFVPSHQTQHPVIKHPISEVFRLALLLRNDVVAKPTWRGECRERRLRARSLVRPAALHRPAYHPRMSRYYHLIGVHAGTTYQLIGLRLKEECRWSRKARQAHCQAKRRSACGGDRLPG